MQVPRPPPLPGIMWLAPSPRSRSGNGKAAVGSTSSSSSDWLNETRATAADAIAMSGIAFLISGVAAASEELLHSPPSCTNKIHSFIHSFTLFLATLCCRQPVSPVGVESVLSWPCMPYHASLLSPVRLVRVNTKFFFYFSWKLFNVAMTILTLTLFHNTYGSGVSVLLFKCDWATLGHSETDFLYAYIITSIKLVK